MGFVGLIYWKFHPVSDASKFYQTDFLRSVSYDGRKVNVIITYTICHGWCVTFVLKLLLKGLDPFSE